MTPQAINLAEKLTQFESFWSPRVIAEMNDYQFKLVKLKGESTWRQSGDTDETFFIVAGEMQVGFRDRDVTLRAGELLVIPKGVEHITRASEECHVLLLEPRGGGDTGDGAGALTVKTQRRV